MRTKSKPLTSKVHGGEAKSKIVLKNAYRDDAKIRLCLAMLMRGLRGWGLVRRADSAGVPEVSGLNGGGPDELVVHPASVLSATLFHSTPE